MGNAYTFILCVYASIQASVCFYLYFKVFIEKSDEVPERLKYLAYITKIYSGVRGWFDSLIVDGLFYMSVEGQIYTAINTNSSPIRCANSIPH